MSRYLKLASIVMGACLSAVRNRPSPNPILLTANVVDPESINAVSMFNSCSGHAFPATNSPNSAKNYFWPNSTNFSTNDTLREFAACDGTIGQHSDDTDANEQDRGRTYPICATFASNPGSPDIFSFAPVR